MYARDVLFCIHTFYILFTFYNINENRDVAHFQEIEVIFYLSASSDFHTTIILTWKVDKTYHRFVYLEIVNQVYFPETHIELEQLKVKEHTSCTTKD